MKYYLVAGEASGDLHGSNLMKEIKTHDPQAEFRFWGGDLMKAQGGTLVRHYKDHDFMGIIEVVKHLPTILNNISSCKKDIASYKPDAVIFVDFPGFNLQLVSFVKKLGIKTFYYISPTIWAWKESRANIVKKYVDHMFCIFPFEKDFYKTRHNHDVDFVGHPLLDSIYSNNSFVNFSDFRKQHNLPADKEIIAILPGSRTAEVRENLKIMQAVTMHYPNYQFVIAGMNHFEKSFYEQYITNSNITVLFNMTYQILHVATAAIVVSGSATLETAIIGTPQIIVYKTNPITFWIGKNLVKLKFIGLPNIIMDRAIVPEILQENMTPAAIRDVLDKILYDKKYRQKNMDDYKELAVKLGGPGASKRTATLINRYMNP